MNDRNEKKTSDLNQNTAPSLFSMHLSMIENVDHSGNNLFLLEQQEVIKIAQNQQAIPHWQVKTPYSRHWPVIMPLAAIAAATLLMIFKNGSDDLTPKGQTHIVAVTEKDDIFAEWSGEGDLSPGTKVSAEITAHRPSIAFMAVYNSSGTLLTPMEQIVNNQLQLNSPSPIHFSQAMELDDQNEGENLVIVACDKAILTGELIEESTLAAKLLSEVPNENTKQRFSNFCTFKHLALRR